MWWTALVIGFAGSLHCLGMCSPLALAVTGMRPGALVNRFLYNAGRTLTYGILGSLVAGVGYLLPFDRLQDLISISLGLTMLAIGIGGLRRITIPGVSTGLQKTTGALKALFSRQLGRKGKGAIVLMGTLNGLLPCGLTFVALSWCITLRGPLDGFNFMLLFGIGTLPVMLGLTSALPLILKRLNWSISGLTTAMIIIAGVALITRALITHLPHTASAGGVADILLCR